MSLQLEFSPATKQALLDQIVPAFNKQRGTSLPLDGFNILVGLPSKSGGIGISLVTKRRDDFLRIRLNITSFEIYNEVGIFKFSHESNYTHGLESVYWDVDVKLDRAAMIEIFLAKETPLYKEWAATDHAIKLENGGSILLENGMLLKEEL